MFATTNASSREVRFFRLRFLSTYDAGLLGEEDLRTATVEIYSDATNSAVLRHPARRFPGFLIQGDTLYLMCLAADAACKAARSALSEDKYAELNDLRNHLWASLIHYKNVLTEHGIELPFSEIPGT
jgi:hypothetical protein